jgi:hypothetical protein
MTPSPSVGDEVDLREEINNCEFNAGSFSASSLILRNLPSRSSLYFSIFALLSTSFTAEERPCDKGSSRELSRLARSNGEDYCGGAGRNADVEKDGKREKKN